MIAEEAGSTIESAADAEDSATRHNSMKQLKRRLTTPRLVGSERSEEKPCTCRKAVFIVKFAISLSQGPSQLAASALL